MMDLVLDEQLARLQPGHSLHTRGGERVEVRSLLGGGNEGVVFTAAMGSQTVALKLFKKDGTGRREERTAALARLNLSRSLSSAIAGPFDTLSWEDRVGHVAALVPGVSVQELVDSPALLTPRQRLVAALKLGALVLQLHQRGLAYGDLNKGAVKVSPRGESDASVSLVDLDSVVMPGVAAPLTLGTPDTSAPELRRGQQPTSVAAWQAADWTAYGHLVLELLLAKTAACGLEEPSAQLNAFLGIPPCLQESSQGRAVDLAAGLPAQALPATLRRPLARLFDVDPARRDGRSFVQALTSELINNHQVACSECGLQYLVHDDMHGCPGCGARSTREFKAYFPDGSHQRLSPGGVLLTRQNLGGHPGIERVHARLFTIGGVPFVCAHGPTVLRRAGTVFALPAGLHVPVSRGDRIGAGRLAEVLVA